MSIKTRLNYSPNFNPLKRKPKDIKFIVFHYTGMKKESAAIERLTNIQSEVGCHYLIKNNGEIITMVPDLYAAWHAGKSSWKQYKSLIIDSPYSLEYEWLFDNVNSSKTPSAFVWILKPKKKYDKNKY